MWEGASRGRGTYVYLWLIHEDVWKNQTQNCKAIIFQLKINLKVKLNFKKEVKLSLYADFMILYIENLKDSTKNH